MSFNRENVMWQSPNGRWNLAFYRVADVYGDDPEWDVEYDYGRFAWHSGGHASQEAAEASWQGANPGGCDGIYEYGPGCHQRCQDFDKMAAELKARIAERERR